MEIVPSLKEAVKDAVHKELKGATIKSVPLLEILEKANNDVKNNECHLASCRYNSASFHCTNEEKRKECVDVSKLVLCLDGDKCEK